MILTDTQLQQITDEDGFYDCRLLQQRFAYKLFGTQISPYGDAACFVAPTRIGPFALNKALVITGELPNTELFGGACFVRLFCTQLGSLISLLTNKECYLNNDCLFFEDEQISFTILNKVKDSVIFHVIFAIEPNLKEIGLFPLDNDQIKEFQANSVDCFNHLLKAIFIETRRDNF